MSSSSARNWRVDHLPDKSIRFMEKRENHRISLLSQPSGYAVHEKEKDKTRGAFCATPHNYHVRIMPVMATSP
jgi:hypothetical protein